MRWKRYEAHQDVHIGASGLPLGDIHNRNHELDVHAMMGGEDVFIQWMLVISC